MPRGMWWLGHHPWLAEAEIKGLESKASRHGGLSSETYSSVQWEDPAMLVTASSCFLSSKDPAMLGVS